MVIVLPFSDPIFSNHPLTIPNFCRRAGSPGLKPTDSVLQLCEAVVKEMGEKNGGAVVSHSIIFQSEVWCNGCNGCFPIPTDGEGSTGNGHLQPSHGRIFGAVFVTINIQCGIRRPWILTLAGAASTCILERSHSAGDGRCFGVLKASEYAFRTGS